ncbi:hypothetical protein PN473_16625 [Dolichospermum circinale CS-545/17]|nr:hypothetical protein [Dolichospermum circinale CS-545/17]
MVAKLLGASVKKTIKLSLSPQAIPTERFAIAQAQSSLKELAKATGCKHPNPEFNEEFGFYQCPLCGEVWAFDEDDPDYKENPQRVTIETDNPKFVAALIGGKFDEVM